MGRDQVPESGGWRKLHILSTEDDPQVRVMLSELLEPDGHELSFARNSDDFFNLIDKHKYDLLILDVNVPGLNGYQMARAVGERFGSKRPKMLLFTGRDTGAEKDLVAISGVDEVLEKGVPLPSVVETISRLTGISGGGPQSRPVPEDKRSAPVSGRLDMPLSMGPLAEEAPAEEAAEPAPQAAPPAGSAPPRDAERLRNRVNTVVSENASLSRRLEAMQRRVAEIEKLAQDTRDGARILRFVVMGLGGIVAVMAAAWLLR